MSCYPRAIYCFRAGTKRTDGGLYVCTDHGSSPLEKIRLRRHVKPSLIGLLQDVNDSGQRGNGLRQSPNRDSQWPPVG